MQIYSTKWQGLTGAGELRRSPPFIWSRQVDAAAGVGEDSETCGGGGSGARAATQWREEEEDGGDE